MLAAWPGAASLRDLNLSDNEIGDDGMAALAESPHLAGLRSLLLNDNCNTEAGRRRVFGSPTLKQCFPLEVRRSELDVFAAFRR